MFSSTGKYHYYNNWLMVDCDNELARYYRHLVHLYSLPTDLQIPMHGSHITVIAGKYEKASNREVWKKYDTNPVAFQYDPTIQTDGVYFWLPVVCKEFETVRSELGLSPCSPIPWHLTIGNLK